MKTFPMFLRMEGRRVVILGGGEQAAQKARLMLKTQAHLQIVAPQLDPELQAIIAEGKAEHADPATPNLFTDVALVFVATGCKGADAAWHAIAKTHGALVNVVDYPQLCDAMTPSIVDRDPLVVAIGTEGNAPVLGRRVKTRIEQILHPNLGNFAALAGRLRAEVAHYLPSSDRRVFWHWVFSGEPWSIFSSGNEREAANRIKTSIRTADFSQRSGRLSLVSGAVGADLVTLGIVERLQAADTIYVEDTVDPAVLELARRDAKRVAVGHAATPQLHSDAALTLALNDARGKENVVYLSAASAEVIAPGDEELVVEHLACAVRPATGPTLNDTVADTA